MTHYGPEKVGQNYNYFGNKSTWELSEPLLATIVIYLSNATRGGEIVFPESEVRKIQGVVALQKTISETNSILVESILLFKVGTVCL